MKIVCQKSRSAVVLGVLLSFVALVGFAMAKGGHGGGHGGGHHGGGHHGSHHSHHSGHHSHHSHHGDHHHHTHVHHHYHGGGHHGGWGYGGYGGWGWGGWGGGLWGVPFGYPDSAPYSVPYNSGDVNIDNSSNDGPEDGDDDDDDDSDDDEDSGEGEDEQTDDSQDGETATGAATTPNRGALHVKLPTANATVLFDGEKMMGFGKERWILTPKMATGESTKFQIQAVWTENGKDVKEVREGTVTAGQKANVDFTTPEANAKTVSTLTDGLKAWVMPLLHSRIGNTMVN